MLVARELILAIDCQLIQRIERREWRPAFWPLRFEWAGIAVDELDLAPVRVGLGEFAGRIELRHLFVGEIPADGAEVLPELLFVVARADNDAGTVGRCKSQFNAICDTVLPVSAATVISDGFGHLTLD